LGVSEGRFSNKMKKDNGSFERMSELRANYGKGTKMVKFVKNKDGSISIKKFKVK
jgi:hypothetical protein